MRNAMKGGASKLGMVTVIVGLVLLLVNTLVVVPFPSRSHGSDREMALLASGDRFTFGASGDFGFSPGAQATMAGAPGLDFFIPVGDFSYNETTEKEWCDRFESHVGDGRVILIAGNHDAGELGGGNINDYVTYCNFGLGVNYTGTYGKEYYFDYPQTSPLARFILTGCGVQFAVDGESDAWNCVPGDPHYEFVKEAIDDAQFEAIPWIIVGMHKNCITSGSKGCSIGQAFFDLLLSEKVDLILQGHDHNYQRSKQLTCAIDNSYRPECVVDGDSWYAKGAGSSLVIVGAAGRGRHAVNRDSEDWRYFAINNDDSHGQIQFTVTSTNIEGNWVGTNGEFQDAFTISSDPAPTEWAPANTWQGSYYDNWHFTDMKVNRTDAAIDFDWGSGSPDARIDASTFSVRWVGKWDFDQAGTYTFTLTTDDGARAWLDDQIILDRFFDQGPTTYTVNLDLGVGPHFVKVEYYENRGDAQVSFSWSLGSQVSPTIIIVTGFAGGAAAAALGAFLILRRRGRRKGEEVGNGRVD